jgi:hypothetical protein
LLFVAELVRFGGIVFAVAAVVLVAVLSTRIAERIRVPPGALFLLAAAVARISIRGSPCCRHARWSGSRRSRSR